MRKSFTLDPGQRSSYIIFFRVCCLSHQHQLCRVWWVVHVAALRGGAVQARVGCGANSWLVAEGAQCMGGTCCIQLRGWSGVYGGHGAYQLCCSTVTDPRPERRWELLTPRTTALTKLLTQRPTGRRDRAMQGQGTFCKCVFPAVTDQQGDTMRKKNRKPLGRLPNTHTHYNSSI